MNTKKLPPATVRGCMEMFARVHERLAPKPVVQLRFTFNTGRGYQPATHRYPNQHILVCATLKGELAVVRFYDKSRDVDGQFDLVMFDAEYDFNEAYLKQRVMDRYDRNEYRYIDSDLTREDNAPQNAAELFEQVNNRTMIIRIVNDVTHSLWRQGNEYVMTKQGVPNAQEHELYIEATDAERLWAHWVGFCTSVQS